MKTEKNTVKPWILKVSTPSLKMSYQRSNGLRGLALPANMESASTRERDGKREGGGHDTVHCVADTDYGFATGARAIKMS